MAELIDKYIAVAVQYCNSEQEISEAATKRNLKRMKEYFEWGYEQYSYGVPVKFIAFPEY